MTWEAPVDLEPPFIPFPGHSLPRRVILDDGQVPTMWSRLADAVCRVLTKSIDDESSRTHNPEILDPPVNYREAFPDPVELSVTLPHEYEPRPAVFEQCIASLAHTEGSLAFEVFGDADTIATQIATHPNDAEVVNAQLGAHFPEAAIIRTSGALAKCWRQHAESDDTYQVIREFGLDQEFMIPLSTLRQLAIDPMVAVCAALSRLGKHEAGVFQILFQPVRHRWAESTVRAVTTERGDCFFVNAPEMLPKAREKLSRSLFAVVVRVAAAAANPARAWEVFAGLAGALELFGTPQTNSLIALEDENADPPQREFELLMRCSNRSGMILNGTELASIAHLPTAAVEVKKLKRGAKRTKRAPEAVLGDGVVLGANLHEGIAMPVALSVDQRIQHTYCIGSSGSGKSTLLANMILQDIAAGRGIALIEPHGDLVDQIAGAIPEDRIDDVILFDPSDREYPIGFNVLSAHNETEKELLAADLVAVFRRLSTSWGDQMNVVLGNAILAFVESARGGTLDDLRRFLVDRTVRKQFLESVSDPEVIYYWTHEFPILKSNSIGPLLTRLNTFLMPKIIRHMVGQPDNKIDVARIMNEGKIFLAKLSHGLINPDDAYLLGTLLVAKFYEITIARQEVAETERRPFFLYIDEFHHFVTPSLATILSGVRKYKLGLTLAHHELEQLARSPEVLSAVLSHPLTRICFRVGDHDARRIAEGFESFEANDLQNLSRGEAIMRVERADADFNLSTVLPDFPAADIAASRRARIRANSRVRFARSRASVEELLATRRTERLAGGAQPSRKERAHEPPDSPPPEESLGEPPAPTPPITPPPAPAAASGPAAVPPAHTPSATDNSSSIPAHDLPASPPPEPAKAKPGAACPGPTHTFYQDRIVEIASGLRFTAHKEVPLGDRRIDVLLTRGEQRIAVEISQTTSVEHELRGLGQLLAHGIFWVVMVATDRTALDALEHAARQQFPPGVLTNVRFCLVEDVWHLLQEIKDACPTHDDTPVVNGWKVSVAPPASGPKKPPLPSKLIDIAAREARKKRKKRGK